MYYIYNNSPCTAKQGFWADHKWIKTKTTLEFAFAKQFETYEAALRWLNNPKYNRIGIIFQRKDN